MNAKPNGTEKVIRSLSNEQLSRLGKRTNLHVRVLAASVVGCLVAGIWVDWRFFPTAVVLLVLVAAKASVNAMTVTEAHRRIEAAAHDMGAGA